MSERTRSLGGGGINASLLALRVENRSISRRLPQGRESCLLTKVKVDYEVVGVWKFREGSGGGAQ